MNDTETGEPNIPAKKKKTYVRPTCTVIPVQMAAHLLIGSVHDEDWEFGPKNDIKYDKGPIRKYDMQPNKTSKFKHGYWVDDDDEEEDW